MTRPPKDAKIREKKYYALFMKRSAGIYSGMRARRRKLEGQSDKMLPFTIASLRIMLEHAINGACPYCTQEITVKTMSADHKIPVERGGKWGSQNIEIICRSCNLAKGRTTRAEFGRIMDVLNEFDPKVRNEVLGRLKAGASVIRLQFLKR